MRRNRPQVDSQPELTLWQRGVLMVCDASGETRWTWPQPTCLDFLRVGETLWSYDGEHLRGHTLASGEQPPPAPWTRQLELEPGGRFYATPIADTVIWSGETTQVLTPQTASAPPMAANFAWPMASNRWITWQRGKLALWRSHGALWETALPGKRVVEFALVETLLVIGIVQANDDLLLAFVHLNSGELIRSVRVASTPAPVSIHLAPLRHWLLLRQAQKLTLIDVRSLMTLRMFELDARAHDLALEPRGKFVALLQDDAMAVTSLEELAPWQDRESDAEEPPPATAPVPNASDDAPAASASRPTPALPPTAPAPDAQPQLDFTTPLLRLRPRAARRPRAEAQVIHADLSARAGHIAAATAVTIALEWNSGRLTHEDPATFPYYIETLGTLGLNPPRALEAVLLARQAYARSVQRLSAVSDPARATPWEELIATFGLTPTEQYVLTATFAPAIVPAVARLYQIAMHNPERRQLDAALIKQLLAGEPSIPEASTQGVLLDGSKLRRLGLVRVTSEGPHEIVSLDQGVVDFLFGLPLATSHPYLRAYATAASLDTVRVPDAVKARLLDDLRLAHPRVARVIVAGRPGAGRRTTLAALAHHAGYAGLGCLDCEAVLTRDAAPIATLNRLLTRAIMYGLIPCLENAEAVLSRPEMLGQFTNLLEAWPFPLMIRAGETLPPMPPGFTHVSLPMLSETARGEVWAEALRAHNLPTLDPAVLAGRYRLGTGTIHRVVHEVAPLIEATSTPMATESALDRAARQYLDNRLSAIATKVTKLATWADVVLPADIVDSLSEFAARLRLRRQVYEAWGFDRSLTTARGITALFSGTPGTGKTMVAGAIARDLGVDLYRVDVSQISSKWIGETEKNLAQLFDAAEESQAMLLFDEADSLFAKRTEVRTSVDRYANQEVNYLLQRLDSFEGVAILTSNFGTAIDPAFKRRLTYRIAFPFPDEEMRRRLWSSMLPAACPRAPGIDFELLSRKYRMSGGYIRNCVLRAAFLAAAEQTIVAHEHLERAVQMEFREMGKLADSGVLE